MTSSKKIFKDPIYGYISIPLEYMSIVDSPSFQRLRRISQTSYSPLYSSALHNRFVHSIGVFHLGSIASRALRDNSKDIVENFLDVDFDCFEIFKIAALLHDVGHSPFSHTGEDFYLQDNYSSYTKIHEELVDLVSDEDFSKDVASLDKIIYAKPHEIMSAIIGLKQFPQLFENNNARSFFARCITGYLYKANNECEEILNCLISVLNSKVIDVDKLDYLIRDAFIIGYYTVKIDYERLLNALTIIENSNDGRYELAYNKSAISVIENVVYARDAEKKWIQSHPVVLYESFIVQESIKRISSEKGDCLFSSESISPEGVDCNGTYVRLLCDDDIIYFAKNKKGDLLIDQYFDRTKRMHSIWKSEAEFKASILNKLNSDGQKHFQNTMNKLLRTGNALVINRLLAKTKQQGLDEIIKTSTNTKRIREKTDIQSLERQIKLINCLLDYAKEEDMKEEFVIISSSGFRSGFDTIEFDNIKIQFDESNIANFNEIVTTLFSENKNKTQAVYYIYYHRVNDNKCKDLCRRIIELFN